MCFVRYPQIYSFQIYNSFKSGPVTSHPVQTRPTAPTCRSYTEVIPRTQVNYHKCFHYISWKPDVSKCHYLICEQTFNRETEMRLELRPSRQKRYVIKWAPGRQQGACYRVTMTRALIQIKY